MSRLANGPLNGIKVLDLSRVLAGPLAGAILGDPGADVIKIEHPVRGDDTRDWGSRVGEAETTYYNCVNRNRTSVIFGPNRVAMSRVSSRPSAMWSSRTSNRGAQSNWGWGWGQPRRTQSTPHSCIARSAATIDKVRSRCAWAAILWFRAKRD